MKWNNILDDTNIRTKLLYGTQNIIDSSKSFVLEDKISIIDRNVCDALSEYAQGESVG